MRLSLNFVSYLDMFSVPFMQSIRPRDNSLSYRSVLGGFVSLIICTLGMMYASNIFLQWFQNQLIMKISSQHGDYNSSTFQEAFQKQIFKSQFSINFTNTDIDPFEEKEIYLIPLLMNLSNPDQNDTTFQKVQNLLYFHNPIDHTLDVVLNDSLESNQYILTFVSCIGNENYLTNNQKCASQEQLTNFLSIKGLELDVFITQYTIDVYTAKISQTITYISMYLQKSLIPEYTIILEYSYYELRSGQFFEQTTNTYMLNTNFLFFTAFCEPGFLEVGIEQWSGDSKFNLHNIVAQMYLGTDSYVNHVIAEYPSISEMFANVGSTFQAMMLIRFIILYFNRNQMKKEFQNFCRDLYFPEIKGITSVKKGKDLLIYHEKKRLDPKKYSYFLKELDKKIEQKMNFSNLIYEISKMQTILQDMDQYSQQKRSALNLKIDSKTQLYEIINLIPNKLSTIIMDQTIDPFLYSYPLGNQAQQMITSQVAKSETQFQREILIFNENEEIQLENKNIIYSGSLRPQLSF